MKPYSRPEAITRAIAQAQRNAEWTRANVRTPRRVENGYMMYMTEEEYARHVARGAMRDLGMPAYLKGASAGWMSS